MRRHMVSDGPIIGEAKFNQGHIMNFMGPWHFYLLPQDPFSIKKINNYIL